MRLYLANLVLTGPVNFEIAFVVDKCIKHSGDCWREICLYRFHALTNLGLRDDDQRNAPGHYAPGYYALGHYAPRHYAPGHYAPGHYAPGHYALGHYAPRHYAPGHYALGHYAPTHTHTHTHMVVSRYTQLMTTHTHGFASKVSRAYKSVVQGHSGYCMYS